MRAFTAFAVLLFAVALHAAESIEGTLVVVWGDPRDGVTAGGETRYALAMSDGTHIPLRVNGHETDALLSFGKHVIVSGERIVTADEQGEISVDGITRTAGDVSTSAVTGTKKVIFLLVKFSDDTAVPQVPAFYTDLTNPDTPPAGEVFPSTINAFFKKTSNDQFSWIADVGGAGGVGASGGWLTLPHPKSYYAPCDWSGACAQIGALGDDATALGRAAGIDFTAYDNINFVLSNDLDCCAWGGGYYSSVDGKAYGATWEPPWGQETGTYVHEMGHSIGLPHSGWVYSAYDSPWDMMSSRGSASSVQCGSYTSINSNQVDSVWCTEPGDGYIGVHRNYLGWIPAANAVTTDTGSGTSVTLEGSALPMGAAKKLLIICITGIPCSGSTAHFFTVEARVGGLGSASQFDNAIPGDGVIIHDVRMNRSAISGSCFFNSQSGWAVPIDSTPGDWDFVNCSAGAYYPFALYNAQWTPGQTYTNGFTISVVSHTGSSYVVTTTGKGAPAPSSVSPGGGTPSGGTSVTITGANFVSGSSVTFGGFPATNVVVVNDTTITATSPAHTAGTVAVVVTNSLEQTGTLNSGFIYTDAPIIGTHPQSQTVATGGSAALSVVATGVGPFTYQWYSGVSGTTTSPLGGAIASTYNTPALSSPKSYWVRVSNGSGFANSNTATISVAFTDSSLSGGTTIKRAHIAELRTRIDALRLKYGGLGAYAYTTDPTISAGVTTIKAQHIVELRTALSSAYVTATGHSATYTTDPSLSAGTPVKGAHVTELRALVVSIE